MEGPAERTLILQGAVDLVTAFVAALYIGLFVWGRYDLLLAGVDWVALLALLGAGLLSAAGVTVARTVRARRLVLLGSSAVQTVMGGVLLYLSVVPPITFIFSMPFTVDVVGLWLGLVGLPGFVLLVMGLSGLVVLRIDPSGGPPVPAGRTPPA